MDNMDEDSLGEGSHQFPKNDEFDIIYHHGHGVSSTKNQVREETMSDMDMIWGIGFPIVEEPPPDETISFPRGSP